MLTKCQSLPELLGARALGCAIPHQQLLPPNTQSRLAEAARVRSVFILQKAFTQCASHTMTSSTQHPPLPESYTSPGLAENFINPSDINPCRLNYKPMAPSNALGATGGAASVLLLLTLHSNLQLKLLQTQPMSFLPFLQKSVLGGEVFNEQVTHPSSLHLNEFTQEPPLCFSFQLNWFRG